MSDDAIGAAIDQLYGVGLGGFVVERKRLADERKAAGDKAGAAAVGKLARPSMSAWVVNRLWRDAREELEALLAAGDRVRGGDQSALDDQRAILAKLRAQSAAVLVGDGHAASPATLQRIGTTLKALSALGTWAPDRPGALVADRDPPGFDVMIGAVLDGPPSPPRPVAAAATPRVPPTLKLVESAAERPAAAAAERKRIRAGERAALTKLAAGTHRDLADRTAERDRARVEVDAAETTLARAKARLATADTAYDEAADRAGRVDAALVEHDAAADDDDGDDDS